VPSDLRAARRTRWHADIGAAIGIVCVTALLELAMGRTVTYRNGPIRPWVSEVHSDQNSQQISDWYTFSHIIHGALFYGVTHLTMGPASLGMRAAVAVAIEATWESYENTDTVINRYRAATIALGYYGDSVLNSMSDILACMWDFCSPAVCAGGGRSRGWSQRRSSWRWSSATTSR
jgi:hypothetical protein